MRIAVVSAGPGRGWWLSESGEDGARHGTGAPRESPAVPGTSPGGGAREGDGACHERIVRNDDLPAVVAARERAGDVRWIWAACADIYPALLRAGVPVRRCHDVALTEALLLAREGRPGEPASLAAAWARLRGAAVPAAPAGRHATAGQGALFEAADPAFPGPRAALGALVAVHAGQMRRIAGDEHPGRFALLAAAESAGGLAAAEMSWHGLPWRADVHAALLTGLLGDRPVPGMRPARLAGLTAQISGALGRPVNPDSPAQVLRALADGGIRVPSTRARVLREVDHPAAALLCEYKELARLYTAHGWSWLDGWVSGGRFRPDYVVGGVVSGRWATRGGGALQIPRVLRRAVVADPGWVLVVADAAQLEPRVLAALSGDEALAAAAVTRDLYQALAGAFGGDRAKAKVALLSAMYGGAAGEARQLLAVLRHRFPLAARYVELAARAGEAGGVVRSRLGRTCPPPSAGWRDLAAGPGAEPRAGPTARARGRFTRNFVVQASAADWAMVFLAELRRRLALITMPNGPSAAPAALRGRPAGAVAAAGGDGQPRLVFFQHDEVIVHSPEPCARDVVAAVGEAAGEAGRLVFGPTPVTFPVATAVVACYADAK